MRDLPIWYANPAFWVLLAVLMPFFLFVTWYGVRSPGWYKNPAGRGIMILANSIVLVLGRAVVNLWFPDYPLREQLGYLLLGSVAVAGWYLFITLLKEQRIGRQVLRDKDALKQVGRRDGKDRRQ